MQTTTVCNTWDVTHPRNQFQNYEKPQIMAFSMTYGNSIGRNNRPTRGRFQNNNAR